MAAACTHPGSAAAAANWARASSVMSDRPAPITTFSAPARASAGVFTPCLRSRRRAGARAPGASRVYGAWWFTKDQRSLVHAEPDPVYSEPVRLLLSWSDRGTEGPRPSHRPAPRAPSDQGPVLRFLEQEECRGAYDRCLLLAGRNGVGPARELERELRARVPEVELRAVDVRDPSDHAALFRELTPVVDEVRRRCVDEGWGVDVLLSAGTPQAQTIWVILVQSGLLRARMLQVIPAAFVPDPHPRAIREVKLDIEGFPEVRVLRDEVVRLRAELRSRQPRLVGSSAGMRALLDRLARVAVSDLPVLVLGETGTGKELIARTLHEGSRRAGGPFVAESCGALAEGVLASELFGHEAGAFSGAAQRHRGLFEQAHGGTIFLDEIGEMPLQVQAMLLRVLQEGVVRRVGGERSTRVDVRVVAATHRDLRGMIREGKFREDLYYRLEGTALAVPPLRERSSDLPLLVDLFWREVAGPRRKLEITRAAMARLAAHDWPGNVRELRSEVHRWSVFCDGAVDVADLSEALRQRGARDASACARPGQGDGEREGASGGVSTLAEAVQGAERAAIARAMEAHGGNLSRAARGLDIERNTLKRKLRALRLDRAGRPGGGA
jgi:DNA-binding NtrC family response regulator